MDAKVQRNAFFILDVSAMRVVTTTQGKGVRGDCTVLRVEHGAGASDNLLGQNIQDEELSSADCVH